MLENIKFQTNGPFLKTTKNFQPFFSGVSRENALKKAPNSAQIPWLYGHFYGSRPNAAGRIRGRGKRGRAWQELSKGWAGGGGGRPSRWRTLSMTAVTMMRL